MNTLQERAEAWATQCAFQHEVQVAVAAYIAGASESASKGMREETLINALRDIDFVADHVEGEKELRKEIKKITFKTLSK